MKKKASNPPIKNEVDELRSEYDLRGAVRGRHYRPLHEGYTIEIHKADGTTEVQQVRYEAGTVRLDPDVLTCFPDSQSVNRALRSLMGLMAQLPGLEKRTKQRKRIGSSKQDFAETR